MCSSADQKARLEQVLAELTGQRVQLEFELLEDEPGANVAGPPRAMTPLKRLAQVAQHAMVRRAGDLFGAQPVRVDEPPSSR